VRELEVGVSGQFLCSNRCNIGPSELAAVRMNCHCLTAARWQRTAPLHTKATLICTAWHFKRMHSIPTDALAVSHPETQHGTLPSVSKSVVLVHRSRNEPTDIFKRRPDALWSKTVRSKACGAW
jgi:hypothetical protein